MKKILMFGFSLFSCMVNAALTREDERHITEAVIVNTLLPDTEAIREAGFEEVAIYMGNLMRMPYVKLFTQEHFCIFLTRFLNDDAEPHHFLIDRQESDRISRVFGPDAEPFPLVDFLSYIIPVRREFRNHVPSEASFCSANYALLFADLYVNAHADDMDQDPVEFQKMIAYIRERRDTYSDHNTLTQSLPSSLNWSEPRFEPNINLINYSDLQRERERQAQRDYLWRLAQSMRDNEQEQFLIVLNRHAEERQMRSLEEELENLRPRLRSLAFLTTDPAQLLINTAHLVQESVALPGTSQVLGELPVRKQPVRQAAIIAEQKIKAIAEYEGKRKTNPKRKFPSGDDRA
jgi:hypothetical protein